MTTVLRGKMQDYVATLRQRSQKSSREIGAASF